MFTLVVLVKGHPEEINNLVRCSYKFDYIFGGIQMIAILKAEQSVIWAPISPQLQNPGKQFAVQFQLEKSRQSRQERASCWAGWWVLQSKPCSYSCWLLHCLCCRHPKRLLPQYDCHQPTPKMASAEQKVCLLQFHHDICVSSCWSTDWAYVRLGVSMMLMLCGIWSHLFLNLLFQGCDMIFAWTFGVRL